MNRYVALLRGVNIGGKNKISMSELKKEFVGLGFEDVITYLNSGNVVFSYAAEDKEILRSRIETMIRDCFDKEIMICVISQEDLREVLNHAPEWWGDEDKEIYDNLIFLMPSLSYEEFYGEIGGLKTEYEKAYRYENTIFWSFSRKDYQKTNWWARTANSKVSGQITIRTANTVRKIVNL